MSKKGFRNLTLEERAEVARGISARREEMNMPQSALASAAGVSRQTISNIERGETSPQEDVLIRIMTALGVQVDPVKFDQQTESWLVIIGGVIESIPEGIRASAVDHAIRILAMSVAQGKHEVALAAKTPQPNADGEDEAFGESGA